MTRLRNTEFVKIFHSRIQIKKKHFVIKTRNILLVIIRENHIFSRITNFGYNILLVYFKLKNVTKVYITVVFKSGKCNLRINA